MKKSALLLLLSIVVVMAFSLTSCSKTQEKEEKEETTEEVINPYEFMYGDSQWSGLLDNTYPFSLEIHVTLQNKITGRYWPNATRSGAPSEVTGRIDDNSINFEVHTNGIVSRAFIGTIDADRTISGTFQSGYYGTVRKFVMHML